MPVKDAGWEAGVGRENLQTVMQGLTTVETEEEKVFRGGRLQTVALF